MEINYLDDNVQGSLQLLEGTILGDFSKYVLPVITAWYEENKNLLIKMWTDHKIEMIPDWE